MVKRIDLFMPPRSQYQVLHYLTERFAEALERTGIQTRVLESHYDKPQEFIDTILNDRPNCTLSFNGLLPDKDGNFFCDLIDIPHVACLLDAPQRFVALALSKKTIITEVDRFSCDFLEGLNCKNVLFMPHAVDRNLILPPNVKEDRPIDVLLLASFIDYEEIYQNWKKHLPEALCSALLAEAEIALVDRETSYVHAMARAVDKYAKLSSGIDPRTIDFLALLDQFEDYINGRDRVGLVRSIQNAEVHIYGSSSEKWKKYAPKTKLKTYDGVDFEEGLKLMRQSKIVLNSCPSIKNGAHERIFAGIACGAAVLTDENAFMHENFKQRQDILFYRHGLWQNVNLYIDEYISNPQKRIDLVLKGQEVVREGHTWDHRAAILVSELTPIIKRMKDEG